MRSTPALRGTTEFHASDTLHVRPWPDDVLDTVGFDPRSEYAERTGRPTDIWI